MANNNLPKAVIKKINALATSALGLVAALAWNNVITEVVDTYVKPLVGKDSGLISLALYALIITAIAVIITLQLSRLEEKLK